MKLTDSQWKLLEPLIPTKERRTDGRGRPPLGARALVDGAPWADMSPKFPPGPSCHRYFQGWVDDGTWDRVLKALAEDLYERGGIDIREGFIDGSFAAAKKGALVLAKLSEAKGPRHVLSNVERSWQS